MIRLILAGVLALALSSCVFLVDDTPKPVTPVTPVTPVSPVTPQSPQVTAPAQGSYTYRCTGGTVVVNYIASNQVRVFYDGAFQTLTLTQSNPSLIYRSNNYAWEWNGRSGNLSAGGRVVLNSCAL